MKKKKATLYIRKTRININKKKNNLKLDPVDFGSHFLYFFRRKKIINNKKSFIRFLNKFISTNLSKVYNFIKIFGLNKSYRMRNLKIKSNLSKKLFKKFKIKKFKIKIKKFKKKFKKNTKKKVIRKYKEFKLIRLKYARKFEILISDKSIRKKNISGKKKLCLFFSYRHLMSLPVRGQRTKTNAKTRKDFQIF